MLKCYFPSQIFPVENYKDRLVDRRRGQSICTSRSVIFDRSAKRWFSGSSFESFSRHFTDGQKKKRHRKRMSENRLHFKNKTQLRQKNFKPSLKETVGRLAAMQNRKWGEKKKRKGLWIGNLVNPLSKNRIYACSVCSNVLLSFCAGLGRRIDLVLFGTQQLQQQNTVQTWRQHLATDLLACKWN